VSPERGGDIPDMTAYVREVMRRVERDLISNGTVESGKLTWIAVNHHNTDNPHAHVLMRGKQANGADLVIPRHYISYGIRDRASDVATELLGERSAQDVQLARSKEVEAERFTSLDRMIERHLQDGKIDVSPSKHIGYGSEDRRLVVGRLQFLEQMDLAHKGRGTVWEIEANFKQALRELGDRNDIIRQLYSQMGHEAGRVVRLNAGAELSEPIAGVVIAKGSTDEIGEDRFVVVRGKGGEAHYGRVRDGDGYRDLDIGSVAELGAGQQRKQKVAEQIAAVAKVNGGLYSAKLHEAYLRASQPDSTDREIDSNVRSAVWRLNFVAGFDQAGVSAAENGVFTVEPGTFTQFSQRGSQRTDVRVIAEHPLAEQVEAHAATWLDRQAFGRRADERTADHPNVQKAIEQRREWLLKNGYARRDGDTVELLPGALDNLAAEERTRLAKRLARKYGLPVNELPQGGDVEGEYRGTEHLHSGKLAIVVTEESIFVSPVSKDPEVSAGSEVTLHRGAARESTVELAAGQSMDLGVALDGPGGD
jgi:type IV secretory pathway VirD2 relaxase